MNPIEYERMYRAEDAHWWYVGMRALAQAFLADAVANSRSKPLQILDAGCGTGRNLAELSKLGHTVGIDYSRFGLRLTQQRQHDDLGNASVCELPFADATFDLVTSFEVLYHQAVADDVAALREFWRVLKPGGQVLLRLPAHAWLTSQHDRAVHTSRRYTRREVQAKLQMAGFTVRRLSYVNVLLFPLAVIKRLAEPILPSSEHDSDLEVTSQTFNVFMARILSTEVAILRHVDIPFYGLSVIALAQK